MSVACITFRQLTRRMAMNLPSSGDAVLSISSTLSSMTMSDESPSQSQPAVAEQASQQAVAPEMAAPKTTPKKISRKVELKPGHSLTHWVTRAKSGEDMTCSVGISETRIISKQELEKHATPTDCWMAVRGKVYNVTKYLDYHPGGVDVLLEEGGKEATALFDKNHRWVNIERLLASCQVGVLKTMTLAI